MNLAMLLEMAAEGGDERVALGPAAGGLTYATLLDRARRAAAWFSGRTAENVGLVDVNSPATPVVLFGAAIAGRPFAPLNYRWSDDQLRRAAARLAPAVLVVDAPVVDRVAGIDGVEVVSRDELSAALDSVEAVDAPAEDTDAPAV
ncbi:MAG TPA: AMP-binding protein, partial [Acidimicrobiales bacterium]